jgi:hypothetical protein
MKGFLQLLSQWRGFLLLDRSQNGDLFLEARQLPVRQALAEDASQNVVLAEAAQHSQLLQLRRLDFQQEFLIQPVRLLLNCWKNTSPLRIRILAPKCRPWPPRSG